MTHVSLDIVVIRPAEGLPDRPATAGEPRVRPVRRVGAPRGRAHYDPLFTVMEHVEPGSQG